MASRIQTNRFFSTGQRPAAGSQQSGELYVNVPDKMLGVVDDAESPADLIPVRFFSVSSAYSPGAHVLHEGKIRRCISATGPGTFVESKWAVSPEPVELAASYRDMNADVWGSLGDGLYTLAGEDYQWFNAPWDMLPGIVYRIYASVMASQSHFVEVTVTAASPTDHDNTIWTRSGLDWAQAKTKSWARVGSAANVIVKSEIQDASSHKIGQQWYSTSTSRLATKIVDDGGKHVWVEVGRPSVVNTNVLVPIRPPIYADGPLDASLYAEGQWWMDTQNNIAKNRYQDTGGTPTWVEFFTFTPPA